MRRYDDTTLQELRAELFHLVDSIEQLDRELLLLRASPCILDGSHG